MEVDRERFISWLRTIRDELGDRYAAQFNNLVLADLYPFFEAGVDPYDMAERILFEHIIYDRGRVNTLYIPSWNYRTYAVDFGKIPQLRTIIYIAGITSPTEEDLDKLNNTGVEQVYILSEEQSYTIDEIGDLFPINLDNVRTLDPDGRYTFRYEEILYDG